jgi:hypothetical protein
MRKRKLLLLAIIIIASNFPCFSQKCEVSKDPITGEKLITANYKDRWVYLESKNDQIKFSLMWWFSGALNETVPKGSEVIFKLENGEIIKLNTVSDADPKRNANQVGVFSAYTYEFIIDKAQLNKFASSKSVLIRLPDVKSGSSDMTGKDQFGNLSKDYFKAIQKGSKHILTNS